MTYSQGYQEHGTEETGANPYPPMHGRPDAGWRPQAPSGLPDAAPAGYPPAAGGGPVGVVSGHPSGMGAVFPAGGSGDAAAAGGLSVGGGPGFPPGAQPPPYLVAFSPAAVVPAPVRPGGRKGRGIALGAAAVLVLGFGAAFGVSKYAEHKLCGVVKNVGDRAATAGGAGTPDAPATGSERLRDVQSELRNSAGLLLFNADLKKAADRIADDIDRGRAVEDTDHPDNAQVVEMISTIQALDAHFRQAQEACGLPADGLVDKILKSAIPGN